MLARSPADKYHEQLRVGSTTASLWQMLYDEHHVEINVAMPYLNHLNNNELVTFSGGFLGLFLISYGFARSHN